MSRLSLILNKIFKSGEAQASERAPQTSAPASQPSPAAPVPGGTSPAPAGTTTTASPAPSTPPGVNPAPAAGAGAGAPAPQATVDVAAVLSALAAKSPGKLDWKKSIVDLLKLLDLDSSITARKELAKELHYTGDPNDSAAMNMWLHKAVMQKLAENGGKVPADLKD